VPHLADLNGVITVVVEIVRQINGRGLVAILGAAAGE
jgi:hypothetical protein